MQPYSVTVDPSSKFAYVTNGGANTVSAYTINATTYPWWTDDTRIIEIQLPVVNVDDRPTILPRESWQWVSDGETRKLRFPSKPFRTGQTFTVKVNRPGNSRLKLNATARATVSVFTVASIAVVNGGYYTSAPAVAIAGIGSGATATAVLATTPGPVTSITVTAPGTGYTATPTVLIGLGAWNDQTTQTASLIGLSDECVPDVRFLLPMMLSLGAKALSEMGSPAQTVEMLLGKARDYERRAAGLKKARMPRDENQGVMRIRRATVPASRRLY